MPKFETCLQHEFDMLREVRASIVKSCQNAAMFALDGCYEDGINHVQGTFQALYDFDRALAKLRSDFDKLAGALIEDARGIGAVERETVPVDARLDAAGSARF